MGHAVAFGVGGVVEGAGVAVVEVMGCVLLRLVHADGEGFDGFGVLEVGDRVGSVFCDFDGELGFRKVGGGVEGDRSVVHEDGRRFVEDTGYRGG